MSYFVAGMLVWISMLLLGIYYRVGRLTVWVEDRADEAADDVRDEYDFAGGRRFRRPGGNGE